MAERTQNTTCVAPSRPGSSLGSYEFAPVNMPAGMDVPMYLTQAPGVNDRYYVLERAGRVKTFRLSDSAVTEAANFSSQVVSDGEGGALSMAFHPNFSANRYVFVFFTASPQTYGVSDSSVAMISVVRRYTVSADGRSFSNPQDILAPTGTSDRRLHHAYSNHKGGWIGFSPLDGYLYITLGDGGEAPGSVPIAGDFSHPSQDLHSLHGKVLRIDVNSGSPYAIPADNPFAAGGGLPEVYAWGLRNPWRASFDRATGDFWVGDVGEGDREEIN